MRSIKIFIAEICIAILRKLDVSVIIGFSIKDGVIHPVKYDAYWYDSQISDETVTLDCEGFDLKIPRNEKFSYSYISKIEKRAS